jgi:hypothetical protein
MSRATTSTRTRLCAALRTTSLLAALAVTFSPQPSSADENGISFWIPGFYGSLASVPATPGWSVAAIYYHTSVSAGAGQAFPRGGRVDVGVDARADLGLLIPTYVFETPVMGAQASLSMITTYGRNQSSAAAILTGPLGNTISANRTDTLTAFGDLVPQAALKWHQGVNNYMFYVTGDIPVGAYDPDRLANLGIGHGAIDSGFGYTYFNPETGHEFSVTTGITFNFENTFTNYQNGIDWHTDFGLSQFLTKQLQIGLVGYLYQQISPDNGSGAILGPFESRVAGIGPQIGYIFPVADMQGYVNLKGYKEFAAENRPDGWNVWLTFSISPAPPKSAEPSKLVTKAK